MIYKCGTLPRTPLLFLKKKRSERILGKTLCVLKNKDKQVIEHTKFQRQTDLDFSIMARSGI